MRDCAGSHEDFKEWRDKGGGDGKFEDFVRDHGDRFPDLKEHNTKLLDRKGGNKAQLGQLLD